ncbi:hypothetical protein M8J75_005487 [Diaphorina citri]|nr:hypothetical protein M8J75_005487 [Diaphorina citri]
MRQLQPVNDTQHGGKHHNSMPQTESSCAATSPSVAFRCHMTVPTKSSIAAQRHSSSISIANTPLSLLIDSSQHTP